MPSITPNLWFDTESEEAANFYCSVFPNSRIVNVSHYGDAGPREKGMVLTVDFELDGQRFTALNGGPEFSFSEAVSFLIRCADQQEVDHLLERADRRWRARPVRVAEGSLRCVVAGDAHRARGAALRPG